MAAIRWKVVFTDQSIRPEAADLLRETCAIQILRAYPSEASLIEACRDADAILARLGVLTAPVIEAAPRLRIIARHGAGSDAVDLPVATRHGVVVTTTGPANAGAVAEYTFALLLALLRHVPAAEAGMRAGTWARGFLVGEALEGRTLGIIVGFGEVGGRIARIAAAFGMRVIAAAVTDRAIDTEIGAGVFVARDTSRSRHRFASRATGASDPGHDRRVDDRIHEAGGGSGEHGARGTGR